MYESLKLIKPVGGSFLSLNSEVILWYIIAGHVSQTGTWFSDGLGSAGLTFELCDLKCLFQPKGHYDYSHE